VVVGDVANVLVMKMETLFSSEMLTALPTTTGQQPRNRFNMPNPSELHPTVMQMKNFDYSS
jgi:hypothetical protein